MKRWMKQWMVAATICVVCAVMLFAAVVNFLAAACPAIVRKSPDGYRWYFSKDFTPHH